MTEELNRRHNLATMPTINNDAEPYIVPFDFYKEGYKAYDISNWFKGRVGDNGTPFAIRWYKGGRLMDVTGMRPFLEGQVGDYTIDDSDPDDPKINMDSEASNVHVVGEVNDCQEYGVAIYRLINQAMPQSGIFYGKIGVMGTQDDGTTVMSSVDVVFKVLAGHMNMMGARKFYVSELEKAEAEFKARLKQHDQDYQQRADQHDQEMQKTIDDARNAYESETKNAHDSLDALKSQIQANRDEQQNLTQHLAGTKQQIAIHDVVTRPEFLDLGNRLNQQVANLRQNKTLYFQSEAELKSKYPAGTDNLCVTLDTKHLWVYDYANGTWTDTGSTDVITADPATKDAIYYDSSNVAPDPDFKIMDGEWYFGRDLGAADWAFDGGTAFNSKIVEMHGYYNESTENNWNNSWMISRDINVAGQGTMSVGALMNARTSGQPRDANVQMQLTFYDGSHTWLNQFTNQVPQSTDDGLSLVKWENITPPANAATATLAFLIHGTGTLRVAQPRVFFYSTMLPYDLFESYNHYSWLTSRTNYNNLIFNPDLQNDDFWHSANATAGTGYKIIASGGIQGSYAAEITSVAGGSISFENNQIYAAKNNTAISFGVFTNLRGTGTASVGVDFWDAGGNRLQHFFSNVAKSADHDYVLHQMISPNIAIPANTDHFTFYAYVSGQAVLRICRPQINFGPLLLPYSLDEELSHVQAINGAADADNLALNPDFVNLDLWDRGASDGVPDVQLLGQALNNSRIARLSNENGYAWLTSHQFNVQGAKAISSSWLLNIKFEHQYAVSLQTVFFDRQGNRISPDQSLPVVDNTLGTDLVRYSFNNVPVPDNAATAYIGISVGGKGHVDIAKPIARFGKEVALPPVDKFLNLPSAHGWDIWTVGKNLGGQVPTAVAGDNSSIAVSGFHSDTTENNWNNTWLAHPGFKIPAEARYLSFAFKYDAELTQGIDDNYAQIQIKFSNADGSRQILEVDKYLLQGAGKTVHDKKYQLNGILVPDGAVRFDLSFVMHNQGKFVLKKLDYLVNDLYDGANDGLPKMFIGNLKAITDQWQSASFDYLDDDRQLSGWLQVAVQGDSSRAYPKKNLKVKLFTDPECQKELKFKPKATWQANNKFNLKANWIDATQARNLVNAQLIKQATAVVPPEKPEQTADLLGTQALGQIEGYPVEIYLEDGYYGLFTFNTKKSDKTYGMDSDNAQHEVVSVELADHVFRDPAATVDEQHYVTEIHDAPSAELKTNFTKFVAFLNNSSDADFKQKLSSYIDVKSCITTMLFGILAKEYDYYSKSYELCTWNSGAYFYMVPYDLDSTWGLYWNGSKIVEEGQDAMFDFAKLEQDPAASSWISNQGQNRLFERLYQLFKPEIKQQWDKLRERVWTNANILTAFHKFIAAIPESAYQREQARWPDLPSKSATSYEQIQKMVIQRGNAMDEFMSRHFDASPATPR